MLYLQDIICRYDVHRNFIKFLIKMVNFLPLYKTDEYVYMKTPCVAITGDLMGSRRKKASKNAAVRLFLKQLFIEKTGLLC